MEAKKTRERMPFRMVITNNETGEVIQELDMCALTGAAQTTKNNTASIGLTACNALELVAAIAGAQEAIAEMLKNKPEIKSLLDFTVMAKAKAATDEC